MRKAAHTWASTLAMVLSIVACSGGDSLDPAGHVGGVVSAPNGELARSAPGGWMRWLADIAAPPARAVVGIEPVGAGVEVRLALVDTTGAVFQELAASATDANGTFRFALASNEDPGSSLVLRVGDGPTLMRAFVYGENVDIDSVSEAALRLVLHSGHALANFSAEELEEIHAAVASATADVGAGSSVAETNGKVEQRAADDAAVTTLVEAAGSS